MRTEVTILFIIPPADSYLGEDHRSPEEAKELAVLFKFLLLEGFLL